ncbi:integrator complex subunit 3 isoform X1 [Cinnamomum micranthum f. kanehirae]|uniref:Integrator complex subunit 3 isoform X1 n=1 Tax=Cinnamomum micranthum f. kanehirae TaxID=337451 RepID=A0A3S3NQA4_9MAGN|nr:integrator complex subunit 3 isoform X1 [Cinnamomum micranthum f. kanehirae]
MTSKLLQTSLQEAENQTDLSLREAHTLLKPLLKPPFPLSIPTHSEYLQLNRAIAYAILTEPGLAHTHFTHLAAIITDGYEFFVNLLIQIAIESYPKLLVPARFQLIWACSKLVGVSAIGVENLLLSLLRQINGGDFSQPNLWLAMELIQIFSGNWDWVVSEHLLLTSGLYTYLRLLADHYRLSGPELDELKRSEIEFCIRALRECFGVCWRIGRDLLRLLQDLSHIPEFRDVWKDLLSNPAVFRVPGFSDISQMYHSRTSTRYFLLRITPDMETQLRFLLTHVNWGSQKRYQAWFAKKFLCTPERETIICDIVRFICCAHHPTNEILQSNVISRWAVIGWLLKCCRKNHIEVNAKLALFYDWLFFDEKVDNIMNIEPALLLMVNSIPKYIDMTHTLLEFLFLLVDNYDINRKHILVQGVLASFDILLRKGVVHSFENFTSCSTLSAILKQRLCIFIPSLKLNAAREALADHPHYPVPLNLSIPSNVEGMPLNLPSPSDVGSGKMSTQFSVEDVPLNLPSPSDVGSGKMSTRFNVEDVPLNLSGPSDVGSGKKSTPSNVEGVPLNLSSSFAVGGRKTSFKDSELSKCHRENGSRKKPIVEGIQVSDSLVASTSLISKKRKIAVMGNLVHDLGSIVKQSNKQGLDTLENILFSYAALNNQVLDPAVAGDSDCSPQALAFQVMEAFKCNGYEMFSPLKCPLKEINHDEEVHSATALVIRTFIFSPHERMTDILLFWYEKGHPVGPRLLSYVSRLANEAHATSGLGSSINCHNHINRLSHDGNLLRGYAMTRNNQNASVKENNVGDSLLKRHVDAYFSFMNVRGKGTPDSVILASTVDLKLISQLVTDAFVAYKIYLKSCSIKQSSPDVETLNGICQTNTVSSNGVKGTTQTLVSSLFSDLRSCCGLQAKRSRSLFCSIFCHLSDLSTSKEEFVRLLVDRLDHLDLVATQFDIGLKRFSIFGEDTVMICHLVRTTLTWDSAEQQKFWSLLMSELAVSKVQVEKIVMDLCSDLLDPREDSVAVGGLLQLSRCCSPTPEFVGTIISLPDALSDFAAAVLASWASSSGLMLSNSLAEWLEKLNSNYDAISAKINYSAITELSKFLNAEGMRSANGLSELSERISNVQSKLANGGV